MFDLYLNQHVSSGLRLEKKHRGVAVKLVVVMNVLITCTNSLDWWGDCICTLHICMNGWCLMVNRRYIYIYQFPSQSIHWTGIFTYEFTIKINHSCRQRYHNYMDGMGMDPMGKKLRNIIWFEQNNVTWQIKANLPAASPCTKADIKCGWTWIYSLKLRANAVKIGKIMQTSQKERIQPSTFRCFCC